MCFTITNEQGEFTNEITIEEEYRVREVEALELIAETLVEIKELFKTTLLTHGENNNSIQVFT